MVHRGHNRRRIFTREDDYRFYLSNLFTVKSERSVQVLAYCLMTNHVHLILVPPSDTKQISRLMQVVAWRQTRRFNRVHSRSGTLWEGRYRASCIESNEYLLACYRYVELNPVRAGIVERPSNYCWSSYRTRTGLDAHPTIDSHAVFLGLGTTHEDRILAYRRIVEGYPRQSNDDLIRTATRRNQLIGSEEFYRAVSNRTGITLRSRGQGRPRKTDC